MGKESYSISFKNAEIDLENMRIVETTKDSTDEYNLTEVLKKFDGIQGLSLTIRNDSEIEPIEPGC